jgi:DnaJ-class molecular chaperone
MNAYEILECSMHATQEELKSSYHRLLLIHHPDKSNNTNNSIDEFIKIQSAYRLLSNPEQRASYDSLLKQVELKKKADLVNLGDDGDNSSILSLNKDFELDLNQGVYTRKCRCAGNFMITKESLNKILIETTNELEKSQNTSQFLTETLVICLECDTCSLCINVLII